MTASLHLARYSPRDTGRMLRSMRRHYNALAALPGVDTVRLYMLADLDPTFGGTPTPTRWGLLFGWRDGTTRDEQLAVGRVLGPFLSGAYESWSVSLDPLMVRRGELNGWCPRPEGVTRPNPDDPVMVMTHGRIRVRHVPAFTRHNIEVVRAVRQNPGLVMSVGIIDHVMARATLSLWSSQRAAATFGYRTAPHSHIQQHSLDVPWTSHHFFARFRPTTSSGSWGGRDPVAGLVAGGG